MHRSFTPCALLATLLCLSLASSGCEAPPKSCTNDDTCSQGELCVNGACVPGCRFSYQCPQGQYCDPAQSQCTTHVCQPGSSEACYEGDASLPGKGLCAEGKRWCHDTGAGWSTCYEQRLPSDEVCDRLDNDCDGEIDEDIDCQCQPGTRRVCYTGPAQTQGVGQCRSGLQWCQSDNKWGHCVNQLIPTRELCDTVDNDCNGQIDEDIDCECRPGASRPCYTGPADLIDKGICKRGVQSCTPASRWGACIGQQLPAVEELCNNQDDDCNGEIDDGLVPQTCYSGTDGCTRQPDGTYRCQGACKTGQRTCKEGAWSGCEGEFTAQAQEQCGNQQDDDCNGLIDDQCGCATGTTRPCYSGDKDSRQRGACKDGTETCIDNQWSGTCTGDITPRTEICNKSDDDCDGQIDNIDAKPCTLPGKTGACAAGIMACQESSTICMPNQATPGTEICNGLDDDCDGLVDNNISDVGTDCQDPFRKGICTPGKWVCENGQRSCKALSQPGTESCNGLDDDCNGQVDDLNQTCAIPGQVGACGQGIMRCEQGQATCHPLAAQPVAETCNGQDDDCDGFVDNLTDLGQSCTDPSRHGPCAPGRWQCVTNQKRCVALQQPANTEICGNNIDDDCDGQTDEGCTPCRNSADCPASHICLSGACIQGDCARHSDCSGGKICKSNTCQYCTDNPDCPSDQYCDTTPTPAQCKPLGCKLNSDCQFGFVCDATTKQCVGCGPQAGACPTGSFCEQGRCYAGCATDNDCITGQSCLSLARGGTSPGRCFPTCQADADCPQGFACTNGRCLVSLALTNQARQWGDGSYATSCTAYRYPPDKAYIPSLLTGTYWLQPDPNAPPFKASCDMTHEGGGWMLMARYNKTGALPGFDASKHQLQGGGAPPSAPPDLSASSTFGHIRYDTHPDPSGREIRVKCTGTNSGGQPVSLSLTQFSLFSNWQPGTKGTYNDTTMWAMLAYNSISRGQGGLCGTKETTSATNGGVAFCRSQFHIISIAFDNATGNPTIHCDGNTMQTAEIEIWFRQHSTNPIIEDSSGARYWKDGNYAPTCREYRDSTGGEYIGATGSGRYFIQPPNAPIAFPVYCDMDLDLNQKKGGWTLIAKYHSKQSLSFYNPFAHQIQNTTNTDQTVSSPPDLTVATTYGHVNYQWFPLRELRLSMRKDQGPWRHATPFGSYFTTWQLGDSPPRVYNITFATLHSTQSSSLEILCDDNVVLTSPATGLAICRDRVQSHATWYYAIYPQSPSCTQCGGKPGIHMVFQQDYLQARTSCPEPRGGSTPCYQQNLNDSQLPTGYAELYIR